MRPNPPETTNEKLRREAYQDLNATQCKCGAPKTPGRSFCRVCYYALPHHMRKLLFSRIGEGYEAAWIDAIDFLLHSGRIKEKSE